MMSETGFTVTWDGTADQEMLRLALCKQGEAQLWAVSFTHQQCYGSGTASSTAGPNGI